MTMGEKASSFTIHELATAANMTPRNVRAYRTRGLLPPPTRQGRTARYDGAHLRRLVDIRQLSNAGVPLRMISDAIRRGASLGPDGDLWRFAVGNTATAAQGASAPMPTSAQRPPARTGPPDHRRPSTVTTVDVRDEQDWHQLDRQVVALLSRDTTLLRRLVLLGVLNRTGPAVFARSEVAGSLRALARHGIAPDIALAVALHAAEATQALATAVGALVADTGQPLTRPAQQLLVRLSVGVARETLARELEDVG
jgi:DNA-binding transcriptional MerR regulator